MKMYRRFLHAVCLVTLTVAASGCQSPDTYKYKMSPYSPATSSLWDSYTDPLPGWWSDTKALFKSGMETNFTPMGPPKAMPSKLQKQETNFNRFKPLYMKVYKISVVEEYRSPKREPNVEHLLPATPSEAVWDWSNRLRTAGGLYHMELVIRDGSVVSSKVDAANRRYDARLEVEMRIYDRSGKMHSSVAAVSTRSAVLSEQATIEERENVFRRMMSDLIDGFNGDAEQKMFSRFAPYIDFRRNA